MAKRIRIEAGDPAEGSLLVQALAVRGLNASLVRAAEGWAVELVEPRESTERLLRDVRRALEGWLLDRKRASVSLRIGGRVQVLAAPAGGQPSELVGSGSS